MNGYLDELDITVVEEGFTTKDLLEGLLKEASQSGSQEAFFVADLGDVVKKHLRLLKALPRVKPFYAVKCNRSKGVVQMLASLGVGFGCTSKPELALVKSVGVSVDRIICTGPCKQMSQIRYAASQGVQLMTFDNEVELGKVARSHPTARMILSLATDESKSPGCPSVTFGATLKSCRHLLETAKDMNMEVVGVSFHIGRGFTDTQIFTQSIADARLVFEMGAELGYKMRLLDIGGGFPGAKEAKGCFEETTTVVNSALDLYFPEGCGVEIIAELGRYYVDLAFTFVVNIVGKKEVPLDQPGSDDEEPGGKKSFVYHLNDGVYGSFSSVIFNNTCPVPVLHKKLSPDPPLYNSSLWGPTGDNLDRIAEGMELPELHVGDWLIFETMGAYTGPASSSLSGEQPARIYYAMSRVAWEAVQLLQGKLLLPEEEDQESTCAPLSCGWEITETLCVTPVFAPASIM
ncbi:antizyme inhibitor 2 isoform X1 [Sphaerodactylus townsendi]|uniref:antizyme inhibitor 2 isoform X1 n=1 Tax=Sphaerodactylus townsendi TaxID=933632 RepID=UPI002026BD2A|nr:antizyme inhibitor 2 isoform X1 [Sphaerodactylus townsendi]XP_048357370.1 antizyme inhibitor 2 isoform X1 [Sphaerodactylus townsendi]